MTRHPFASRPFLSRLLVGLTLGLVWGVGARVFMRLVSSDPEFSWSGTSLIVGLSGLLGLGLGAVAGARAGRRHPLWLIAPIPGLILFLSPGMVLAIALGGGAVAGRLRTARARAIGTGTATLATLAVVVFLLIGSDEGITDMVAFGPGVAVFALLSLAVAAAGSVWSRPWHPDLPPSGTTISTTVQDPVGS